MADNLQIKTEKLIKYANEKFGTNEADLRSIIDSAEVGLGGEYNIDQIIDGDECELVITLADGKEVFIDLPDTIKTKSQQVCWFQVTNDKLILTNPSQSDVGIFEYVISTNTFTRLVGYSGGGWKNFHLVCGKCFISGTNSTGFYMYDPDSGTLTKPWSASYEWIYFFEFENGCLIGSNNASNSSGILFYDKVAGTFTKIIDCFRATVFKDLGDNILIGSQSGIILYNKANNSAELVYSDFDSTLMTELNSLYFFSSNVLNTGLCVYDPNDNSVTKVNDTFNQWVFATPVENGILLSSKQAGTGVLLYDLETKTTTQLVTKLSGSIFGYRYFVYVDNGVLLCGETSAGVWFYDYETKSVTKLYNTYGNYFNHIKLDNVVILTSTATNYSNIPIMVYNIAEKTVQTYTRYSSSGRWERFKKDGDNCYVYSVDNTDVLYYDAAANAFQILKIKIEV